MSGKRRQPPPVCLRSDLHTPQPGGYIWWMEWAEEMSATHHQVQCPGCALWVIWVPTLTGMIA